MSQSRIEAARELANQTWQVLNLSDIPEGHRDVAFGTVFSFLADDNPPSGPTAPPRKPPSLNNTDEGATGLASIADALKLDEETASYLFAIDGPDLDLTISRDDLSSDRVTALREVALLVVAARQAGGIDQDRTASSRVRDQGVHLGVMAKNTFRQEMGALSPELTSKPQGRFGRSFKITRVGYDAASTIAMRIATTAGG